MTVQDRSDKNIPHRDISGPFTSADLPFDDQGRIYHLQMKPEDMAPDILIVGDPGRAEIIGSSFFSDITHKHQHRGLVSVTGKSKASSKKATIISPLKTTVATSGMGTPSLEIVLQELVALNEIDFKTRMQKKHFPRLQIIRIGTSGGLQASTALGTAIITSYSIGMDNTGHYYGVPYPDENCARIEKEVGQLINNKLAPDSRFHNKIFPYVSRAEPIVVKALSEAAEELGVINKVGLTVSCSGFFAPQGRDICRIEPSLEDIDQILSEYDPKVNGQLVENMEMEASFLNHFINGLGYWSGAICTAIANRKQDSFYPDYQNAVNDTINIALQALATLRAKYPDPISL